MGAGVSEVSVTFYDGDPDKGGRLIAVERIHQIAPNAKRMVQTSYQATSCGIRRFFAVVNRGKPSEVVRRSHPVRVDCKGT